MTIQFKCEICKTIDWYASGSKLTDEAKDHLYNRSTWCPFVAFMDFFRSETTMNYDQALAYAPTGEHMFNHYTEAEKEFFGNEMIGKASAEAAFLMGTDPPHHHADDN